MQVLLAVIAAVHELEYPVAAGLHWQVQLMRALFALGHCFEELLGRVLRVARHKADEEVTRNIVHHTQEICKIHPAAEILAVGIDVLTEQRNVLVALLDELARLF